VGSGRWSVVSGQWAMVGGGGVLLVLLGDSRILKKKLRTRLSRHARIGGWHEAQDLK